MLQSSMENLHKQALEKGIRYFVKCRINCTIWDTKEVLNTYVYACIIDGMM